MTQTVHSQSRPRRHPPRGWRAARGFTIAEMAVVVVIMAVVMTASLKLLGTQIDNAAIKQSRDKHAVIEQALIWHLRTFGHLPCPDINFTPTPATGVAALNCPTGYGVVPWVTLGLPRDAVIDGWGSFIGYRVASGFGTTNTDWTAPRIPANPWGFSIAELTAPPPPFGAPAWLQIQERDASGNLSDVTNQAVVVLISHGRNSDGSVKPSGAQEGPSLSTDELTNHTAPYALFVTRPPSLVSWATSGTGLFDDVVTYMQPRDFFQPLINEGSLKGPCRAHCATPTALCVPSAIPIPIGQTPATCP